jgi:hypothetical protein
MGDLGDIVNAVTAVATVLDSNVVRSMPNHAHAVPRRSNIETMRGWHTQNPIGYRYYHSSACSRAGICSHSIFDVMVEWKFGGSQDGLGLFLHDAYVYVDVTSVGLGHSYTVTAKFDEHPTYEGSQQSPVAVLGGEVEIYHEYWKMTEDTIPLHFSIKGDGAGLISP